MGKCWANNSQLSHFSPADYKPFLGTKHLNPRFDHMATPKQEENPKLHHDVTVIGAGWSGLVACKYMLEEGLSVVALEKREDIGGVWLYSNNPSITTVMQSTRTTSSSTVTEMSDFPMPEEIGMFPHHKDVWNYLHSYAKTFNLMPHIKLNIEVETVEKEGEVWSVCCSNGDTYTSKYLVVASGEHQDPNRELEESLLKGFTGKIYHAQLQLIL